jgi:molecular chaperone HtpG
MENKSVAVTNEKVSNYIPEEISFSILSKLPLKSLKRFQCVRKSWSLLFENQYFVNLFRNNFLSYSDPASFILRTVENRKEVFYSFCGERFENKVKLDWANSLNKNNFWTHILGFGSINGTFCVHGSMIPCKIVLWEPATQTMKFLPPGEAESLKSSFPYEDEANVHVFVNWYLHGFGYDNVINDYKVIRYVDVYAEDSLGEYVEDLEEIISLGGIDTNIGHLWEIYSLRSNSWRKLHVDMPYSSVCRDGTQVYVDGVCHWLCESYSTVGIESCLVSFYLNNETFFITPLPSDVDYCSDVNAPWVNLAALNGFVALISYHEETTSFHISILSEFGMKEKWTKLLIVGPLSCVEHPIGVGAKGEIVFIRKDEELVWLDLSTQMIVELGFKGVGCSSRITMYKECILPIGGISN